MGSKIIVFKVTIKCIEGYILFFYHRCDYLTSNPKNIRHWLITLASYITDLKGKLIINIDHMMSRYQLHYVDVSK